MIPQPIKKSKPRTKRWFFVTLVVFALVYLGLSIRALLLDADASLDLSRISGPGLDGLIVNRATYSPPMDSVLTATQLGMLVHVSSRIEQLSREEKSETERRTALALVLNHYTTSLSEYRWVLATVGLYVSDGKGLGTKKSDSANRKRLAMILPQLVRYNVVFRDSLDREALLP